MIYLIIGIILIFIIYKIDNIIKVRKRDKKNQQKGADGEEKLYAKLLGNYDYVFNNLIIDHGNDRYTQIDFICIDSTGIYVIECKNYNCMQIEGSSNDQHWKVVYKNGKKYDMYNPILQNSKHVKVISKTLGIDDINSSVVFMGNIELKIQNFTNTRVTNERYVHTLHKKNKKLSYREIERCRKIISKFENPSKKLEKKQIKYAKKFS